METLTQTPNGTHSRAEAAHLMGVSPDTLTEWTKQGCPVIYLGTRVRLGKGARIRYNVDDVRAWLNDRYKTPVHEREQGKEVTR